MKYPGIHIRLLISAFLLICASTFTLDLVCIHITTRFMKKRFNDRISFLAKYLAQNAEVGILIGDKFGLRNLALNLLSEEDVAQVTILDNLNEALVDLSKIVVGPLSVVESEVLFKRAEEENILFQTGIRTPVGTIAKPPVEKIGNVRIAFSTHGIDTLMVEITKQFIWVSSGLAIIACLVFYFISRTIGSELMRLTTTARQIGRGDFELRANPGRLPETQELSLAFNKMLDSLAESQKALERVNREMVRQKTLAEMGKFAMMVAHEVKNPLGIIKSSLDIFKKESDPRTMATMIEYIEDEVRRLNRLIEDFLLFSRPAKPNFRQVDLNEMIRECIVGFQIQTSDLPVDLKMNIMKEPCVIQADMDLLIRAVGNIIKNAIEANGHEGIVEIKTYLDDHFWITEIKDQGEGIDSEILPKLFEPFFTTRSKGTGLGLAFASQVILAHHGHILAMNREDRGGLFRVELPVQNNIDIKSNNSD